MIRKVYMGLREQGIEPQNVLLLTGRKEFSSERDCVAGAEEAMKLCGEKETELRQFNVSLNEVQAFGEILEYFHSIDAKDIKAIIASNECLLDGLLEVLNIYDCMELPIFVPKGDCWNVSSDSNSIHFIPRKAVSCGKKCAELMELQLAKPMAYDSTQTVISTDIVSEYPVKRQEAPKKLRILLAAGPMATAIESLSLEYSRRSGVQVECKIFAFQNDLYQYILDGHKKHDNSYDLFMMDHPWVDYYVNEGCVLPLNEYLSDRQEYIESFLPGVWEKVTIHSEQIFGVPLSNMSQLMLYRKDLFEDQTLQRLFYRKHGLPLELPRSWAEFNFLAQFFTRSFNEDSPTQYGTCLCGQAPTGLVQEFLPRQWSQNGSIMEKGKVVIDSIQNVRALNSLKGAYACSPPDIWGYMENEQVLEFCKGEVAMINTYNGHLHSLFDERFSNISDSIGFARIPGKSSLMGSWFLAINAHSEQPELSFEFIRWLTSDGISLKCSLLGGIVPKKIVSENEQVKRIFPWNNKMEEYLANERPRETIMTQRGRIIHSSVIDEIIADGVKAALYEDISSNEALSKVKVLIEKVVR